MEKVHLLKYPEVNGVVLMELGLNVVVRFERGDCVVIGRDKLGKGHLVEGLDEGDRKDEIKWMEQFRKKAFLEVKDEVVGEEVGDV